MTFLKFILLKFVENKINFALYNSGCECPVGQPLAHPFFFILKLAAEREDRAIDQPCHIVNY